MKASDMNAYDITPIEGREWRQIVVPRKPLITPLPLVSIEASRELQLELFSRWGGGLEAYTSSATFELKRRPIPHAFKASEVSALTELFKAWLPTIVSFMMPQMTAPFQTYNPVSRLGDPYWAVPTKKQRKSVLKQYMKELVTEGPKCLDRYEGNKIAAGVRLQTEPPDKVRSNMYLRINSRTWDTETYLDDVSPSQELMKLKTGERVSGSRTRLIFLLSPWNLVRQILDTAWHKVLLSYDAFKHNMYDPGYAIPSNFKYAFAFDVKHFERHNAPCAYARAEAIGGAYARMSELFQTNQFIVPDDTWRYAALLRVRREAGYVEQYTSGSSEVAPL